MKNIFLLGFLLFFLGCKEEIIINPTITATILSPESNSTFFEGDTIEFKGKIIVEGADVQQYTVWWLNGTEIISIGKTDANGNTSISTNRLLGNSNIELRVIANEQTVAQNSISISIKKQLIVQLNGIVSMVEGIGLYWSLSHDPADFLRYEILRSPNQSGPFEIVETIVDQTQHFWSNEPNLEIGETYFYQIVTHTKDEVIYSNIQSVKIIVGLVMLDADIIRLAVDKTRPYLYAICDRKSKLYILDKKRSEIIKTISFSKPLKDLTIDTQNTKMYLTTGSNRIMIVDLETLEKSGEIVLESGYQAYKILYAQKNEKGYLVCGGKNENGFNYYHANNGTYAGTTQNVYFYSIISGNSTNEVQYVQSENKLDKIQLQNSLTKIIDSRALDNFITMKSIVVSNDDRFVFCDGKKILASDLNTTIGEFNDKIVAVTSDGSIAFGRNNIWNANTFEKMESFDYYSGQNIVVDPNDEIVYMTENNYVTFRFFK